MRKGRKRAVALLLWATACSAQEGRTVEAPRKTSGSPALSDEEHAACLNAAAGVQFLVQLAEGRTERGQQTCEIRRGLAAIPHCRDTNVAWGATLAELRERERADILAVEWQGPWLAAPSFTGETRIWKMGPEGPELRYRISDGVSYRFLDKERLLLQDGDLTLVELESGAIHTAPNATLLTTTPGYIFAHDRWERLFRFGARDLASRGSVSWGVGSSGSGTPVVTADGNAIAYGDTLVSFSAGRVVRNDVAITDANADATRMLGFDAASRSVIEIETLAGTTTTTMAVEGPTAKGTWPAISEPAYAHQRNTAFWFEIDPTTDEDDPVLVVAVGDLRTGKVRRLRDPREKLGATTHLQAWIGGLDDRLCLRGIGPQWTRSACRWRILDDGTLVRSLRPNPNEKPSLAEVGLKGRSEAARTKSPSGALVAIATYREPQEDLTLTITAPSGRLIRNIVIREGTFPLDTSGMVPEGVELGEGTYLPRPALRFLDERRIAYVAPFFPCNEIDVETGEVRFDPPRCSDAETVLPEVVDPTTGAKGRLVAPEEAWQSAPLLGSKCP